LIRRIVLWAWRDGVTAAEKLRAKEGLAYIWFASGVDGMDFGEDRALGPEGNYGLAMERDHVDRRSWDVYNDDPQHDRVGSYIDSITEMERTARIDYEHDTPTPARYSIRHVAMYSWTDGVTSNDRRAAQDDVRQLLGGHPAVHSVIVGDDLGWREGHPDWVVEAVFGDADGFQDWQRGEAAARLAARLGPLTVAERGAQIQHRVRAG
jgi:hypothetical protein